MKNLRRVLRVTALIIVGAATLVSCEKSHDKKGDYLVLYKTDGWTSNYFYCDSAEVISTKEVNYWVRGKETKLLSEKITVVPNN
jgi:hypothetical protein